MTSPFQDNGDSQANLPAQASPFSESQGLAMSSSPSVSAEGSESQMEASPGPSGIVIHPSQPLGDINMALLCRIGQETVQEIVTKTTELFQLLKSMKFPTGNPKDLAAQEENRAKAQESLKSIQNSFKKLRRIYDRCNENSATLEYNHIEVESLIPFKDELEARQEDKTSEAISQLLEEHRELVEAVTVKNRQIKEIIDQLRSFIWDINTMLAMR